MLVSTTDTIPGREVVAAFGAVYGLIVNSRGPFSDTAARVRTAVGGEVGSYRKLMDETRREAVLRLRAAAHDVGANAVLAMRFETTALTDEMVEVVAYGTAALVREDP